MKRVWVPVSQLYYSCMLIASAGNLKDLFFPLLLFSFRHQVDFMERATRQARQAITMEITSAGEVAVVGLVEGLIATTSSTLTSQASSHLIIIRELTTLASCEGLKEGTIQRVSPIAIWVYGAPLHIHSLSLFLMPIIKEDYSFSILEALKPRRR